jgi:hypothetical protein
MTATHHDPLQTLFLHDVSWTGVCLRHYQKSSGRTALLDAICIHGMLHLYRPYIR